MPLLLEVATAIGAELTQFVSQVMSFAGSNGGRWPDCLFHLKCEASGNADAVALITKISPAAWRHILLNGPYTFQSGGKMIHLDALAAGLELE